eukprot:2651275-Pyramimonas_sp.AAC.1
MRGWTKPNSTLKLAPFAHTPDITLMLAHTSSNWGYIHASPGEKKGKGRRARECVPSGLNGSWSALSGHVIGS